MRLVGLGAAGFAIAIAMPAEAQDSERETTYLGEILIQGAVPKPEGGRRDLAFPTTGFGREVIETIPDRRLGGALQRLPGVTMGGAPGERKDVRLRAIDKKFTRTEFGGVQLSDGGEKREFQVFRFPSFLAGEVEVIRNPTAEFEADGLAGRIRVDFREIPEERTIEGSAAVGTGTDLDFGDHRNFQAAYGERFGDFGVQLGFSRVADPLVKEKEKRKEGALAETEDELKDLTFTDGFADLAWYGDNQTLHVRPLILNLEESKEKDKRKFKDGTLDKVETETEDELKRTKAVIVDHEWRLGGGAKIDSTFAWSDTDEDKDKLKNVFKSDGTLDKIETETEDKEDRTFEFKTAATVPFTLGVGHKLKFGGAIRQRDRFKDKTVLEIKGGAVTVKGEGKDKYDLEERYAALFVQDTVAITDRLSVTPGLRYEMVERKTVAGDGTRGDTTIRDVLPSFHARYLLSPEITLRASASQVVNRPKFDQLAPFSEVKDDDLVQGNPDLDPSRAWAFDVGAEYATGPVFLGVNFYHRETEDLIEQVFTGREIGGLDQFRFENVGDGHVQGVELEQRVTLGGLGLPGVFEVRANQTFADSEVFDEFTGRTRRFNESANFVASLGLSYSHEPTGTRLSVFGNYTGEERKTEGDKNERIDGEFSLDVYAETAMTENVSVFFTGENLTNTERFTEKPGETETETAGRTFLVGLKARF